jgi:hypothetical protein
MSVKGLVSSPGGAWIAIGPACVACTVPVFWHAVAALGLVTAASWVHYLSLAATPLVGAVLVANWRRHRTTPVLVLASLGMVALALHIGLHLTGHHHHSVAFNVSNQLGLGLLTAAVLVNVWAIRRLRASSGTAVAV